VGSVAKTREEAADNIFALVKEHREALGFKYEGSHKGEGASKSFNQLWFGGTLSSLEIAKEGGSVHPTLDPNCFCRGSVVQILDQGQPLWVVLWGYRRGVGGGSDYKGAKLVMHDKKDPFQGVGAQQRAGVIELLPVTVNGERVSLDIERDITKVTVNKGTCLSTILKKCSWVNLVR